MTRTRIHQSSKLVLVAGLFGLAMASEGCFRSGMRHSKGCSDADPNCQMGSPGDAGWGGSFAGGGGGGGGGGGPGGQAGGGAAAGAGGGSADGRRDGAAGGAGGGPMDGPRDGSMDGSRDGAMDGRRDGGLDRSPDLGTDVRRDTPGDRSSDVVCGSSEICGNGIDDDCNGLADCLDSACKNLPICIDRKKEVCNNGIDDDGNGLIDCKDPACLGDPACFVPGHEICNNNLDDDDDGLVDCKDPDCFADPTCVVHPGNEICDNGIDDNGDKLVDCSDPQCKTFPACVSAACTADVDFGLIASSGASVTRAVSTVGAHASYNTCAPPGGVARVASFSLAASADVKLDFSQAKGAAHVVAVYRAGVGQACDQNLVDECLRAGADATATRTFNALAAGNYWIIVQSFTGTTGSATITLSTGKTASPEICNNGVDDDGDGAIDCADLDCASAGNCHPCVPDINLGAIVVGDPPKTAVVDTSKGSNRYHPSCAGTSTGKDIVVRFTVKDTVGIILDMTQLSGAHAYEVYDMPKAGDACDSGSIAQNCYDLTGRTSLEASWWPFAAGEHLLIFKATAAGREGQINLMVSAWAGRGVEICNNGLDDDGNGLVDCDDPSCATAVNCQALMCLPDGNLGDIDIGTSKTVNVDLTDATRTFSTFCGKGDGHGRVYRLNLLSPMGLWVQCTQTGDQVLQIGEQVDPLDPCEAHPNDCVDLSRPFGCNFIMPNLQPGLHNLIVQAFSGGTEGTMNLSLTGVSETIQEICDNGIDDDGDGATDCYDLKCAGDASCAKLVCKPDQALGILKLDGTPTIAAVSTSRSTNTQATSACVSGKGGGEAVVGFTLTAKADLTIDWSQFGNHAVVLYKQLSASLPCEANTAVDCHATANAATGSYPLVGLEQGKYYLVVDADKPGSEGGVVLQVSGLPSP